MYVHQVKKHGSLTSIWHFRDSQSASGLFSLENIGHSVAVQTGPAPHRERSRIVVAPASALLGHESNAPLMIDPSTMTECEDLDEFVRSGVEKWNEVVPTLGEVASIHIHLKELRTVTEATSESGLILPSEKPDIEFDGYAATPDEIEAMESIVAGVVLPTPEDQPGLYL